MSGLDGTALGQPAAPPMEAFTTHPSQPRRAIVADANALISDAIRRSRGPFSVMPFLAEQKLVSVLAPEHIVAKCSAARRRDPCGDEGEGQTRHGDEGEGQNRRCAGPERLGRV